MKRWLAIFLLAGPLLAQTKESLEQRTSPKPSGTAGDIPYAVNTTTIGWIPHATGLQCLTQNGTATPVWAACSTGTVTGSGALNQVAIWSSATALTGFTTLTYAASNLHVETSATIADPVKTASTTLRYDNALFGVDNPELEITNSNAASGGFKWNVVALRAQATDQYSGLTFRQVDGRERAAFGFGNSGTDAPFLGNSYFEASYFPTSGTNKPAGLLLAQTGFMGGSNGSRRRLFFDADGLVDFYKTDGTTKMVSLDTVNGYFAVGTAGSFLATISGMLWGVTGAQILRITSTADNAGLVLDANGASKVPFVDFVYNTVKKAGILWDNNAPARFVLSNTSGNLVTINENSGYLAMGAQATTYQVTSGGATNTGRVMIAPGTGAGRVNIDFNESGATATDIGINYLVSNTTPALIRTVALVGSAPVRTAGAETGRLEVQAKPAAAAVTAISRWDGTTLHQEFTGTAPTLSTCGGSPSIVGNDHIGKVTIGSAPGATCTVTFSKVWTNAPACFATNETTANLVRGTTTASVLTLRGTLTAGDVIAYGCMGRY